MDDNSIFTYERAKILRKYIKVNYEMQIHYITACEIYIGYRIDVDEKTREKIYKKFNDFGSDDGDIHACWYVGNYSA